LQQERCYRARSNQPRAGSAPRSQRLWPVGGGCQFCRGSAVTVPEQVQPAPSLASHSLSLTTYFIIFIVNRTDPDPEGCGSRGGGAHRPQQTQRLAVPIQPVTRRPRRWCRGIIYEEARQGAVLILAEGWSGLVAPLPRDEGTFGGPFARRRASDQAHSCTRVPAYLYPACPPSSIRAPHPGSCSWARAPRAPPPAHTFCDRVAQPLMNPHALITERGDCSGLGGGQ
jgi:hypothetical protein